MAEERTDGRGQTLATVEPGSPDTGTGTGTKKYLDYDGLKHLVEKLTNKIEAVGGSSSVEDGVYVGWLDENGGEHITPPDEWVEEMGTAVGAAVVECGRCVLVCKDRYPETANWAFGEGNTNDIGGAVAFSAAGAATDWAGRENTMLLVAQGYDDKTIGGTAVSTAHEWTVGGFCKGRWHLGSAGEWMAVMRNYYAVDNVIVNIMSGGVSLSSSRYYWTSTQQSATTAWVIMPDDMPEYVELVEQDKSYGFIGNTQIAVRPFATFLPNLVRNEG